MSKKYRKILVSESMGVYLGSCMGLGFWSKLDPVGLSEAITFANSQEINQAIATWDGMASLPNDMKHLDVLPDHEVYASIDACAAAGAERWNPELGEVAVASFKEPEFEQNEARVRERGIGENFHE